MAINFPATPTLNQTYTYNGRTWTYNGVGWQATGASGLSVYTKTDFTATAAQTTFTVAYTVGFVDVYYNGSKLSSSEYTATNGTSVVLGTACAVNDIVETIAWTVSTTLNPALGVASATSLAIGGATIGSNALAVTGTTQLNSALNYGGVTLSNAVTGTGSMVLSASPTLTGTLTAAIANFSGAVALNSTGSSSLVLNSTEVTAASRNWGFRTNDAAYGDFSIKQSNAQYGDPLSGTTRININPTGLVGIGTASPSDVLTVVGGLRSTNATLNANVIGSLLDFSLGNARLFSYATAGSNIQFFTNPNAGNVAERARFGSDGSFLVNTTTNGGWGTDAKIEAQASTGCGVSGYATGAGGASLRSRGDTDTTDLIAFYRSTTKCGSFISSGGGTPNIQWLANNQAYVIAGGSGGVTLASAATAWAAVSDETLKTDLAPIQSGAEKVGSLRAVTGRYKTDAESMSRSFLIAQDVQKVLPEAVSTDADGTLSLRYTEVVPLLVAAIQELTTRLAALEAK